MSIEKSEIKKGTAREIGVAINQKKLASEQEVSRLEGAMGALRQAASSLSSVINVWKADLEEDKVPKESADAAIKAVQQCQGCLGSLAEKAEVQKFIKQGEVVAFERTLDVIEKVFTTEDAKAKALTQAESVEPSPDDSGRTDKRVTGQHPGMSLAAQRKAESAKDAPETISEAGETKVPESAENTPEEASSVKNSGTPDEKTRRSPVKYSGRESNRGKNA